MTHVHKCHFLQKRAVTPLMSERTASKYAGLQVHMLIDRFIKFHHCSSYTFWVPWDTSPQMSLFAEKSYNSADVWKKQHKNIQVHKFTCW